MSKFIGIAKIKFIISADGTNTVQLQWTSGSTYVIYYDKESYFWFLLLVGVLKGMDGIKNVKNNI